MSCETGHLNICGLVRSGVILAIGLPVALSIGGLNRAATRALDTVSSDPVSTSTYILKADLAGPCIRWGYSAEDSKLERVAEDEIDSIVGGEISNYSDLCNWVF